MAFLAPRGLCLITCLVLLSACDTTPDDPPPRANPLPQVRNIRPDLPYKPGRTVIHAQHAYLSLDADLSEAWALAGHEGLDADLIEHWRSNGLRIGTMSLAQTSQFTLKLPRNVGVLQQSLGVGEDPVVLEFTPWSPRKFELSFTAPGTPPGTAPGEKAELLAMPIGQTRILADLQIAGEGATLRLVPQHHWIAPATVGLPRSPQEKVLDGKLFAELAMNAKLSPDQVLVLAYEPPPKPPAPPPPPENPAPAEPPDAITAPRPPGPDKSVVIVTPPPPTLGTLLLTGERSGKRLQIVVILHIPRQGESAPPQAIIRPDVATDERELVEEKESGTR